MIEDTLKANPGMRETYRAYGRVTFHHAKLVEAETELQKLVADNADKKSLADAEDRVVRLSHIMESLHDEVSHCLKNEIELRVQQGLAPLDPEIFKSAQKILDDHPYRLKQLDDCPALLQELRTIARKQYLEVKAGIQAEKSLAG